jgi:hemerythrin superfamily protein
MEKAVKAQDAINLLKADHKAVEKMFKKFESLKEDEDMEDEKVDLVTKICRELTAHTQIEEEIFYPAIRKAIDDSDLLDEAQVEHASAKDLIAQLESMKPDEACYDARVTVLGEYVMHHVEEEEKEMFPKVKKTKLDLQGLGAQMAQRKEDIETELESASASKIRKPPTKRSASRPSAH